MITVREVVIAVFVGQPILFRDGCREGKQRPVVKEVEREFVFLLPQRYKVCLGSHASARCRKKKKSVFVVV